MPWYEPEKKLCYCTTTLCSYFHGSVFPTLAIDFYPIKALENCITSFLFCFRNFEFSRPFRGLFWLPKIRPSNSWLVSKTCPKQWRKVSIFVSNLFRCHLNFRRENCYCIFVVLFHNVEDVVLVSMELVSPGSRKVGRRSTRGSPLLGSYLCFYGYIIMKKKQPGKLLHRQAAQ